MGLGKSLPLMKESLKVRAFEEEEKDDDGDEDEDEDDGWEGRSEGEPPFKTKIHSSRSRVLEAAKMIKGKEGLVVSRPKVNLRSVYLTSVLVLNSERSTEPRGEWLGESM